MKRCCFFGHAHFSYEGYRDMIKSIVTALIEHHEVTAFYSGGRGDFDSICARIMGELRRDYPHIENIKFLSYIPTGSAADHPLAPYYTGTVYLLEERVIPKFAISKTNKKPLTFAILCCPACAAATAAHSKPYATQSADKKRL